jgi:hypothetical protein
MILSILSGGIIMGFAAAGLFFMRFWRRTRDMLFLYFAVAFWLLALNHAIIAFAGIPAEEASWVYLLRLAAFSLIIVAIVQKNVAVRRNASEQPPDKAPSA